MDAPVRDIRHALMRAGFPFELQHSAKRSHDPIPSREQIFLVCFTR